MSLRMLCVLFVTMLIGACGSSCTSSDAAPRNGLSTGLPELSQLDNLRCTSVMMDEAIPLDSAIESSETEYKEASSELEFTATTNQFAYAVFRYTPSGSTTQAITAIGDVTLWLLVADYSLDRWVTIGQFFDGQAQIDIEDIGQPASPGGHYYIAVVCSFNESGTLEALMALNDVPDPFGLEATNPTGSSAIMLNWLGGQAESYKVYRTTVENDPEPYLVATRIDASTGNMWMELVPHDPSDNTRWLAANNDNGTDEDTTDDFPFIAPGITYFYRIEGVGGEADGIVSEWTFAQVPWGSRRSTRRELPSSLDQVQIFADQLLPNNMTEQQVQWCAENLCGTQKVFKWQAAQFRQYNNDFVVLGYHLGNGAGNIGNVCGGPTTGSGWDTDADWPYVDRHDDWFIVLPGSSQPGGRVLQQDWNWYVADPSSQWDEYLADNLLQMMGEDHFDGWFVDSCSQPWNTDPSQWWPDGETMFGYFTPRLHSMLELVNLTADAHPLSPYIIPNAGSYVTTVSDIKYYGDTWACDGIMIEGYGRWSAGNHFTKEDWLLELDRVIDHEQHGLAVILQASIDPANTTDRIFMMATYLLVRGEHTYINWLGSDQDSSVAQWYPEWDLEGGIMPFGQPSIPNNPLPANMAALYDNGLYKRHFSGGIAMVNVDETAATWDAGEWPTWEKLTVSGGGNINTDGTVNGTATWTIITGVQTIQPGEALIVRDSGIG